jgi:hypothetical protein
MKFSRMFFSKEILLFCGKENKESFENFRTIILFQHGILKINQLVDKWALKCTTFVARLTNNSSKNFIMAMFVARLTNNSSKNFIMAL